MFSKKQVMQQKVIQKYNLPLNTDDNSTDSIAVILWKLNIKL